MGTRIESVATVRARRGPLSRGALGLADAAARECLERAHRQPTDLDLLVNAGLYKEKNVVEPAFAAIIQEDIGANPGHPPVMGHGTFSFDVENGGCGALTAAYLIDGFARSGSMRLGIVVASDSDPARRTSHGYRFAPVGGAMLLQAVDGDDGFDGFELRTFPELGGRFESALRWEPGRGLAHRGHTALVVDEAPEYGPRCVECATSSVHAFLDRARLLLREVDLLVATPSPGQFPDALASELGVGEDRVAHAAEELGGAHTAGMIATLEGAVESGQLARSRNVLFVAAGAGITIGVALYRTATRAAARSSR